VDVVVRKLNGRPTPDGETGAPPVIQADQLVMSLWTGFTSGSTAAGPRAR
jgi:hypothetical protein